MGAHRPEAQHENLTALVTAVFPDGHTSGSGVVADEDPDSCNNSVGGTSFEPPAYCGNETAPGEEYCTPCNDQIAAEQKLSDSMDELMEERA